MDMGGQNHAPTALHPGKKPGTPCTGGRVAHKASLGVCGKSHPNRDSIPGPSSQYSSLYRLYSFMYFRQKKVNGSRQQGNDRKPHILNRTAAVIGVYELWKDGSGGKSTEGWTKVASLFSCFWYHPFRCCLQLRLKREKEI
jgi:hypothetical protein